MTLITSLDLGIDPTTGLRKEIVVLGFEAQPKIEGYSK